MRKREALIKSFTPQTVLPCYINYLLLFSIRFESVFKSKLFEN